MRAASPKGKRRSQQWIRLNRWSQRGKFTRRAWIFSFFAVFFSVSALSDSLSDVTSLRSWVDFAGVESSVLYHLFCSLVRWSKRSNKKPQAFCLNPTKSRWKKRLLSKHLKVSLVTKNQPSMEGLSCVAPVSFVSAKFKELEKEDPLLKPNAQRWVLLPIKYSGIFEMYKKHEASFWTAEEIDLAADAKDWQSLSENEQHFVKHILAFFAASDGIVLENLATNFSTEIQVPEARAFYGFQMAMENIHSETYSLLIEQYIKDPIEKDHVFNAIATMPAVQEKAKWAVQWMNQECSSLWTHRSLCSCGGCALQWIVLCHLLVEEERLDAWALFLKWIDPPEMKVFMLTLLAWSMVSCKTSFQRRWFTISSRELWMRRESLFVKLFHAISSAWMQILWPHILNLWQTVCYAHWGHSKLFNASNPFDWMELISLQGKTNFFEKRVGDYQKAGVMSALDQDSNRFSLDADF